MKKAKLIFLVMLNFGNIFCNNAIYFRNYSDEKVHFSVDTTQNYPCGSGIRYLLDWCNCGFEIDVPPTTDPKKPFVYEYGGICQSTCTSKISTNKGVSHSFPGGNCSSVIAATVTKDKQGKWSMDAEGSIW